MARSGDVHPYGNAHPIANQFSDEYRLRTSLHDPIKRTSYFDEDPVSHPHPNSHAEPYLHAHAHTYSYTHSHIYTYSYIYAHPHKYTHSHTYSNEYPHVNTDFNINFHTNFYFHANKYPNSNTDAWGSYRAGMWGVGNDQQSNQWRYFGRNGYHQQQWS